jgi:hypothetical protein
VPVAADIKLGRDGKYYADVDGCHWAETTHGGDPGSDSEWVVLQTPCLPYEGMHFYPKTGAVDYFIQ